MKLFMNFNKRWFDSTLSLPEPDHSISTHPAPAYPGAIYKMSSFQNTETSSILAVLLPVDSSFWSLILTLTFWNSSTVTSLLPEVFKT